MPKQQKIAAVDAMEEEPSEALPIWADHSDQSVFTRSTLTAGAGLFDNLWNLPETEKRGVKY